ncbi:ribonuclease III [Rhodovibrionaceae bacterium A322]
MASTKKSGLKELPKGLAPLAGSLPHTFARPQFLVDALTHSSKAKARDRSYERLEFLGDRVLGLVVAEMLFLRFDTEPEGALAKRHAALVRRETLAGVANKLKLGKYLSLSPGEEEGGGRENPAILADACEAVIGALYLDGGLDVARILVEDHWTALIEADLTPPQDNKTSLQEWAQGRGKALPRYEIASQSGPAHDPEFVIRVTVEGETPMEGKGKSKRAAEQLAAGKLLTALKASQKGAGPQSKEGKA